MAIVDLAYYSTVYLGQEASDCDFPALEARAEDVIVAMTKWRVTDDTIASLPPFQRTLVKKAICAQVDWFAVNGLDSLASGTSSGEGFTVGKVTVNGWHINGKADSAGAMAAFIAPMALAYLEQSGLMAPHVATAPDMPLIVGWPMC